MRGKVLKEILAVLDLRITPAYAGKSPIKLATERTKTGSPPHMRGKGRTVGWTSWKSGITPAYAGKSGFPCSFPLLWWDHPRICGEKDHIDTATPAVTGITPAYAGKSMDGFLIT